MVFPAKSAGKPTNLARPSGSHAPYSLSTEKAVYRDGTIGVITDLTRVSSPITSGEPSAKPVLPLVYEFRDRDARFTNHPGFGVAK